MKNGIATFIVGMGLLIPAYLGLLLTGWPTVICPLPALTFVPALLLSYWSSWCARAAVFVPVLFFFAWNPALFQGSGRIPGRSYGLLAVATALSIIAFVAGWKLGLRYQGAQYVYSVCAINIVWVASLWTMFAQKRKSAASSFKASLFLHWALFAWLSWYAFPCMGELP